MNEPTLSDQERADMLALVAKVAGRAPASENKGIVEAKTNNDETLEITGNETSAQLLEMSLKRRAEMEIVDTKRVNDARKQILESQRIDLIDELKF